MIAAATRLDSRALSRWDVQHMWAGLPTLRPTPSPDRSSSTVVGPREQAVH